MLGIASCASGCCDRRAAAAAKSARLSIGMGSLIKKRRKRMRKKKYRKMRRRTRFQRRRGR